VVKDEEAPKEEIKMINQDSLDKKDPGLRDQEGDPNAPVDFGEIDGTGDAPKETREAPKEEPDPDPTAFISVEKEPAPANLDIIKSRITYPQAAKDIGVTGKVIVRVLVGPDGKYVKHMILRSPHNLLVAEVEKHLKSLEFTPGIQAGKPVKCWVTIPFSFNLN
jgi:protein TonB